MKPVYFVTPTALRRWFASNHTTADELWMGFHKKASGKPSVTYHEALDEALCVGWIDGIRKSLNETSYVQRFTPRRRNSIWSAVNIARVGALKKAGRMKAAGLKAFEGRDPARANLYSYERQTAAFGPAQEKRLRADLAAWQFFAAQPPGYRRVITWWVTSAKQEGTRERRLASLIDHCRRGKRIP